MLTAEQVSLLRRESGLNEDALAFTLLPLAAACVRTPLSNLNVGATSRGISGNWYFGGNTEFLGATIQQTIHIRQSAIGHAWLRNKRGFAAIAVDYTPCGHCRQFMDELNSGLDLRVRLPGRASHMLRNYLPDTSGPKDLEIKTLLMDDRDYNFAPQGDTLTQVAITAANRCHMPCSKSLSGVMLECKNGRIFSGSCTESTASGPTLLPLRGALSLLNLSGHDYPDVQRTVLTERADTSLIQWDATSVMLKTLGCSSVERVLLS